MPLVALGRAVLFMLALTATTVAEEQPLLEFIEPDPDSRTSAAVLVGPCALAHTARILPIDGEGKLVGTDLQPQLARVVANLKEALAAAGTGLEHAVRLHVYTVAAEVLEDRALLSSFQAGFIELTDVFFSEGDRIFGPGETITVSGATPPIPTRARQTAALHTAALIIEESGPGKAAEYFGGSRATMLADARYDLRLDTRLITAAGSPDSTLVDDDGLDDLFRDFEFHGLQGDWDGDVDLATVTCSSRVSARPRATRTTTSHLT